MYRESITQLFCALPFRMASGIWTYKAVAARQSSAYGEEGILPVLSPGFS